jgi:hypothetical protein
MTTKITVDAHAGWDVSVTPLDVNNTPTTPPKVVPAGTVEDVYVWDGRKLLIEEIRK